jgi:hypothetical protein
MTGNLLRYLLCCTIAISMIGHHAMALASDSTIDYAKNTQYQHADVDFTKFSSDFWSKAAKQQHFRTPSSIESLSRKASRLYASGNPVLALGLIVSNQKLIKDNINSSATATITDILLKASEFNTANRILKIVNNEGDPSVVANVKFAFAKYYYAHNKWEKTIALIKKIANDLPPHALHQAMLIEGVSLQNLHKHRKALLVYGKIPKNSPFYTAARINMAVANIRQDWWTDGYDILTELLKNHKVKQDKILSDRINTIIGYSFLQQEYFRNSRQAFRKVELQGPYTNQALLGIALDAANQNDYVGALNAAKILRGKQTRELQVDEANLLLPYFYEKLGQLATASAGYSEAIKYFEDRLHAITSISNSALSFSSSSELNQDDKTITVSGETIDLGKALPAACFTQIGLLDAYQSEVSRLGDKNLMAQYQHLRNEFFSLIQNSVKVSLKKKSAFITDYMNQSRYGLARLYDRSANKAE